MNIREFKKIHSKEILESREVHDSFMRLTALIVSISALFIWFKFTYLKHALKP